MLWRDTLMITTTENGCIREQVIVHRWNMSEQQHENERVRFIGARSRACAGAPARRKARALCESRKNTMEWQEIFLNNDEVVRHLQLEIQEIFDRVFLASKEKTNAALFSTYDSEGGTSKIFLTPEAVDICANALAAADHFKK